MGWEKALIIPVDCISSEIGEKIEKMQMRTTGWVILYILYQRSAQCRRRINQDGKLNKAVAHHETQTSLAPSQKSNLQIDWPAPARIRQFGLVCQATSPDASSWYTLHEACSVSCVIQGATGVDLQSGFGM